MLILLVVHLILSNILPILSKNEICKDRYNECQEWANQQLCTNPNYKEYMLATCPKSCMHCTSNGSNGLLSDYLTFEKSNNSFDISEMFVNIYNYSLNVDEFDENSMNSFLSNRPETKIDKSTVTKSLSNEKNEWINHKQEKNFKKTMSHYNSKLDSFKQKERNSKTYKM